ncbi:MAG: hypothetical protein Q9226_005686 [Calogaya cf. arnoldii]
MASATDASLDLVRESRGYIIINMTIIVAILVTFAVILRSLARWRSKAEFGIDDYFIFGSLIPFKISILLLYRRIFATRRFQQATLLIGGLCVGWCIAAILADIFQCRPLHAAFDPDKLFTSQCLDLQAYYRGVTASNLILDLAVLAMPLCMVWQLKLNKKQKISLSGVFLLGGLVCVASLMRLLTTGNLQAQDFPYRATNLYLWSQIEPAAAFICACIPTYRPLFVGLNASIFSNLSFTRSSRLSSSRGKSWMGSSNPAKSWTASTSRSGARRSGVKSGLQSGYSEVEDSVGCVRNVDDRMAGATESSTELRDLEKNTNTEGSILEMDHIDHAVSRDSGVDNVAVHH